MNIIITAVFLGVLGLLFVLQQKKVKLSNRIVIASLTAIVIGLTLQFGFGKESLVVSQVSPLFSFVARIYTTFLRLLVAPVLLFGLASVIVNIGKADNSKELTRSTGLATFILLLNTAIASIIGIAATLLFKVGSQINIAELDAVPIKYEYKGVLDSILGFIPKNIFASLSSSNALQISIVALLLGLAVLLTYKKNAGIAKPAITFLDTGYEIVKQLANIIISITPYGIFALLTRSLSVYGWNLLASLGSFVLANVVGFVILYLWQVGFSWVFAKVSPWTYTKRVFEALSVAFSTRSSFSTVPVTTRVLQENFKLNPHTSRALPSLGASIGMNACAGLWPAIVATATFTALGQSISPLTILFIAGANVIASIGVSGIPGTATVAASASFSILGIPFTLVPMVQSVDFFIDMGRTALNVNGAVSAAVSSDAIVNSKNDTKTPIENTI